MASKDDASAASATAASAKPGSKSRCRSLTGASASELACRGEFSTLAFSKAETETELVERDRIARLLSPFLGESSLNDRQLAQVDLYLDLLLRWNARINLTAVREPEEIIARHFGESLFAARHLYRANWNAETEHWKLLDVGSGAGFPGFPIKIWVPTLDATLLESNQRKATFLREVVRALQLSEVEILATRAENFVKQRANSLLPITDVTVTLRAVERFQQVLFTAVDLLERFPVESRRLALLIGAGQVETARRIAQTVTWADPLPIPQSSQRVLLIGHWRPAN